MRVGGAVQSQKLKPSYLVMSHLISPYISAYPWSNGGFGSKYNQPSVLGTTDGQGLSLNRAGNFVALGTNSGAASCYFYPMSTAGFGSLLGSNQGPSGAKGFSWSPDDKNIAIQGTSSPHTYVYSWTTSGLGTKYADAASLQTIDGYKTIWTNTQQSVIATLRTSPYVEAWSWSSLGFGTKFAAPVSLPASTSIDISMSPYDNTCFAMTGFYPTTYTWSDSTGFGSKTQSTSVTSVYSVSMHASQNYLLFSTGLAQRIAAYPYTKTTNAIGTKFADPATLPTGASTLFSTSSAKFSRNGYQAAISHDTSPYVTAYSWNSSGFGTKFTDPATLPAGNGRNLDILN